MKSTRKLWSYILMAGVMVGTMCMPIMAETQSESEFFYSNELGLELTEKEYDNVVKYISEDELDMFSTEEINYIMSDVEANIDDSEITYVKTTYETVDGKQEVVNEEYISEEEMMDSLNVRNVDLSRVSTFSLATRKDTVQTNMKFIEMNMYSVAASVKKVTLNCTWLSIPQCKSFDVVAFRPNAYSYVCDIVKTDNTIGYQYYDGNTITYKYNNDNIKYTSGGVGLSTNIVDSVSSSLKVTFSTTFATKADPFTVYGTYQHAVNNVTQAQSQSYSISSSGMGGVLNFSSSVYSKYDKTPGLEVEGSIYDTY